MYSTCLFCNRSLGRNEAIEHFQVGSRLAFDPSKWRLWVVCEFCKRWNLTPVEERWEAIEEAERSFRASKLRVSTDNIGLAQLGSGLDLIRVGEPPRLELAAWRYGNEFERRRWRHLALLGGGVVATTAPALMAVPAVVGTGLVSAIALGLLASNTKGVWTHWSDKTLQRLLLRDNDGNLLPVTNVNMRSAALVPTERSLGWELTVPYRKLRPAGRLLKSIGIPNTTIAADGVAVLTGEIAQRAIGSMLPHLNRDGGSPRRIRDAVDVIGESRDIDELLRKASVNTEAKKTHYKIKDGESNVGALPGRFRLALEMALHEKQELRAMEGELEELEDRWRDAETIAAIADSLLTSPDIDVALAALRNRTST